MLPEYHGIVSTASQPLHPPVSTASRLWPTALSLHHILCSSATMLTALQVQLKSKLTAQPCLARQKGNISSHCELLRMSNATAPEQAHQHRPESAETKPARSSAVAPVQHNAKEPRSRNPSQQDEGQGCWRCTWLCKLCFQGRHQLGLASAALGAPQLSRHIPVPPLLRPAQICLLLNPPCCMPLASAVRPICSQHVCVTEILPSTMKCCFLVL